MALKNSKNQSDLAKQLPPIQLKAACKEQDAQDRQATMGTLIQDAWIEAEATEQGVTATSAEINKQLQETKKQLRTERAYRRYLEQSNLTQADLLARLRLQVLEQKITTKVLGTATDSVTARKKLKGLRH